MRPDEMSRRGGPRMASALGGGCVANSFSALGGSRKLPFPYSCLEVRFRQRLGGNLRQMDPSCSQKFFSLRALLR